MAGYPPPIYGTQAQQQPRPLYGSQPAGGLGYPPPHSHGSAQQAYPMYHSEPYGQPPRPPNETAFAQPWNAQQPQNPTASQSWVPAQQPQWGQPPMQPQYSDAGNSSTTSYGRPHAGSLYANTPSPSGSTAAFPGSQTGSQAPPAAYVTANPWSDPVPPPPPQAVVQALPMSSSTRKESGRVAVLRRKKEADAANAASGTPEPPFDSEAYLLAQGFTLEDLLRARAEHAPKKLPFAASAEEIAEHGGHGVRMYFEFVKFYAVIVFVVAAFQIWIYAQASKDKRGFNYASTQGHPWYADFFISSFAPGTRDLWYGVNVGMLIFAFVAPALFALYGKARWGGHRNADPTTANLSNADKEANSIDKIIRLTATGTIDVSARYRSNRDLMLRRVSSLLIFLIFLVAQVFITFGLSSAGSGANFGVSFAISLAAFFIDLLYTFTATAMTEFEKHLTNSKAMRWLTLKLMFFKVANIMAVYGGRKITTPAGNCVYAELAEQFLTLWFVQFVIVIPANIIYTMVWANNFQVYAKMMGSISSDNSSQPYFSVASEYLTVLYIGFLALAGMVVFPLSAVLAFIALFVVYWSAKFRLVKLCGRPLFLERSSRLMVAAGMLLSALAGLLTPTTGGAFVLSGYTRAQTTNSTCLLP